jgi:hypothetical protein
MAYKIQLRRDIAANWTTNNPLLLNGEIGIETDTLKFKVGTGTQRWNSLTSYALRPGEANGVATLGSDGKIPLSQLPSQVSLDAEALIAIQNALSSITTTNISEGNNIYFTNARAVSAVNGLFDSLGSSASALDAAKLDATAKVNSGISISSTDATAKANQALSAAKADSELFTNNAINSLTTSDIEEGTRLYFTPLRVNNIVGPLISETRGYVDSQLVVAKAYTDAAISDFLPPPTTFTGTTSDVPEGNNLYFTNSRAITATQAARTSVLVSALGAVDDLRTEIQTSLTNYIPSSERNAINGLAGLDANSKIQEIQIPSTIARTADVASTVTSAIANVVDSAPTAFDTLKEIATYIVADGAAATALATLVDTKLASTLAATTYSPIASPTFTGTVTIPAGALISGYATAINLTSGLASTLTSANDYTDLAIEGIENSLGGYQPENERNQSNGYAGLDSAGKILTSAVPAISNTMLENNSITINGTAIALGGTVITGYTNGISGSNINKITYGTNITPPSSGNSAGDIYIQY